MTSLLAKIVSSEQGTFIPGRSIFDNISLTQEIVHFLNKKINGGNVLIKIDMAKAHDRVSWNFLLHVLASFGCSPRVCGLIRECVSTPWYSIMLYGTMRGFFKGGRGLRQGDPLSSYFFIIMEELLSRLLKHQFSCGNVGPFSHPRGSPLISLSSPLCR